MSPIENVIPNLVDSTPTQQTLELRNKQDRSRDLFGVQLEVRLNLWHSGIWQLFHNYSLFGVRGNRFIFQFGSKIMTFLIISEIWVKISPSRRLIDKLFPNNFFSINRENEELISVYLPNLLFIR